MNARSKIKAIEMWLFYALSSFLVSALAMIPFNDIIEKENSLKGKFLITYSGQRIVFTVF